MLYKFYLRTNAPIWNRNDKLFAIPLWYELTILRGTTNQWDEINEKYSKEMVNTCLYNSSIYKVHILSTYLYLIIFPLTTYSVVIS